MTRLQMSDVVTWPDTNEFRRLAWIAPQVLKGRVLVRQTLGFLFLTRLP